MTDYEVKFNHNKGSFTHVPCQVVPCCPQPLMLESSLSLFTSLQSSLLKLSLMMEEE